MEFSLEDDTRSFLSRKSIGWVEKIELVSLMYNRVKKASWRKLNSGDYRQLLSVRQWL